MSLQLAAQHLAARGRGPDTTLVHMAPQEVAGLQALAKAHGGTLTVNPDTGLPEAGFLSSILPLAVGAFLGPAGLGLTAMQAGLAGAALGTVATGSLQKGLMAGLGAYGGAGLAGGLMGAGAAGAGAGAGAAGVGTGVGTGLGTAPAGGLVDAALTPAAATPGNYGLGEGMSKLSLSGPGPAYAPSSFNPVTTGQLASGTSLVDTATKVPSLSTVAAPAAKAAMSNKDLWMYGAAGLLPALIQEPKGLPEQEKRNAYEYTYSPGRVADPQQGYTGAFTGERTYFNPVYTRTAAGGGLMDIGPVEAMSRSNQSQMAPAYARGGVSDTAVNPYTGAETFAEGGDTKAVRKVEDDPYYTMSGQSGDAFKYLMGQMPATPRAAAPAAATAPAVVQSTVQPAGAPESSSPFFNLFGGLGQTATQGSTGGEWVDDTSGNIRPYTFDPATGTFSAAAPKKVFRPYTSAPTSPAAAEMTSAKMAEMFGGGRFAHGGIASLANGGQSHLGDYSDGGRLLRGPGDGVSDDIPATIGDKRPARLADGEFVVPARIVSELGNGSTEAGARKLYAMMDRVQKARGKTVGKDRVAVNTKAEKMLPA